MKLIGNEEKGKQPFWIDRFWVLQPDQRNYFPKNLHMLSNSRLIVTGLGYGLIEYF
jgi:hypothetical protein